MPFDSVILFLGIHPKDIIQKYVNALYTKLFTMGVLIIGKKSRNNVLILPWRNDSRNYMDTKKKIEKSKILFAYSLYHHISIWTL